MDQQVKEVNDNNLNMYALSENEDNNSLQSSLSYRSSLSDRSSVFDAFSLTGSIIDPIQKFDSDLSELPPEELKKEIERLNKKNIYEDWKRNKEIKKNEEMYKKQLIEETKTKKLMEQELKASINDVKSLKEEIIALDQEKKDTEQRYIYTLQVRDRVIDEQRKELVKNNYNQSPYVAENENIIQEEIDKKRRALEMSEQSYYFTQQKFDSKQIPGVVPQPDDDSSVNDSSGNIIDASGNNTKKTYKKYTYKEVEHKILDNYFDDRTGWSSSLDIIGSYLRGQKLIYMESKSYCENKLNRLMMPSIFLSTAATVLSAIVKEFYWGAYLIASVNGIIAFLLALVNYLKLDAASEAHKITAHQYDKLQTKIEFLSGQTLLFDNTKRETIEQELESVKKKIEEIKETNQFIVPKKIRTLYPIMFNTNVFLIIKKIDDITKKKINKIKDLKNEKNYLIEVLNSKESKGKDKKTLTKIETRIGECEMEKKRHEENIVVLKSAFSVIDEMFMKEMENAEKYKNMTIRRWLFCGFGIKEKIKDPRHINKFILDIMNPYRDKIEEDISLSKKIENDDIDQLVNDLTQTKKILNNKRLDEVKRRKKTIRDLKKANSLLKDNVNITEEICNKMEVYDKLERGDYDTITYSENEKALKLNKHNTIVKLFGLGGNQQDIENIKLKIHSQEERASISGSENSDPYIDFDVCKRDDEK